MDLRRGSDCEFSAICLVWFGGAANGRVRYGKDPKLTANFAEDIYNSLW